MTLVYRTDDLTRWGAGNGGPLSWTQEDLNFWQLYQLINAIAPAAGVGIASFSESSDGKSFYVTLTDATVKGPFPLPLTSWTYRGVWAPITSYSPSDVITNAGAAYLVLFAHISQTVFSAGANDGHGHDYYGLLVPAGQGVPVGGAQGQALVKLSNADFNTGWGATGVPLGGSAGQVLTKNSGVDLDDYWAAPPTSIPGGGLTGQTLAKNSNTSGDVGWANPPFTIATGTVAAPYTLGLADAWTILQGLGGTITIPLNATVALPINTMIMVVNSDSGPTTIVGASGVIVEPSEYTEYVLEDFRAIAFLTKVGTDIWLINGQLRPNVDATVYSGVVSIDFSAIDIHKETPSADTTYNVSNAFGVTHKSLTFIFTTSGTTSYTITFGTNFISQGTLATGTVSGKRFVIVFVGDGTNYYEEGARGGAM